MTQSEVLAKFKEKFDKDYPGLKYQIGSDFILVPKVSPTGFDVSLRIDRGFVVSFYGWHEHFSDESDAENCFIWGLSNETRLHVFSKWGFDYKWTAEMIDDGKWTDQGTTGLLFYPYWGLQKARTLQNEHVKLKK